LLIVRAIIILSLTLSLNKSSYTTNIREVLGTLGTLRSLIGVHLIIVKGILIELL
jgi:hypothetical protein